MASQVIPVVLFNGRDQAMTRLRHFFCQGALKAPTAHDDHHQRHHPIQQNRHNQVQCQLFAYDQEADPRSPDAPIHYCCTTPAIRASRLSPNAPIHGCCATLWRHAGSSAGAQQTSSLPSRHPPTHRTPTVSLATPAIGAFGLSSCAQPTLRIPRFLTLGPHRMWMESALKRGVIHTGMCTACE